MVSTAAMPAGESRVGHYELIRELGRGGMGRVFLARDTRLGRRVAMKFLVAASAELTERFLIEARATARCDHENIVVIHDVDTHDGQPYMVLEYLEGATLTATIAGRRLGATQAVEVMVPVVRALACAHEHGIVHRDLKPDNIFVTSSGTVKVLDFGVAKLFAIDTDRDVGGIEVRTALLESVPAGTLPYMAPEQVFMDVDERTDLWPVGVILWEMLAGRHPLAPLDPQRILDELMELDRPMPPVGAAVAGLPGGLEHLIDRCLAKRKGDRFQSSRELLDRLEPMLPSRHRRRLAADESPFPGLSAFQEADADRFFGRSREVAQVVARLSQCSFLAVVGPSGVGKTSLVRAGVVPALQASDEAWECLTVRPGRRPLAALASLLARAGAEEPHDDLVARLAKEPGFLGTYLRGRAAQRRCHYLLFVDQLEELHTLGADAEQRAAFLACLSGMADDVSAPLRVIVALRSDFLDRIAEDRRLAEDLTRGLVFLRPLDRAGLREALLEPLELAGYAFESDEMVDAILDPLAITAGALPLLQFAAAKLWDRRDRGRQVLTRETYEAMGGVSGALATHADEVILALSPANQTLARRLLTRLVTPERTREVIDLEELRELAAAPGEIDFLVEHLATARLLVVQTRGDADQPTVELVHESLIERWPMLRHWVDETKEDAVFLAELRAAARRWDTHGRTQGLLWRGDALEEARLWRARTAGELARRDSDFLDAGFALADRAARVRRRLISATIGVLLAVVAGGGVALISIRDAQTDAVDQANRARREADRARAAEQRIREQLTAIEAEHRGRQESNAEVARRGAELKLVNAQLEVALGRAQAESKRAQEVAREAQDLAGSLRRANQELQRLLESERARAEQLERERKKIMTELK